MNKEFGKIEAVRFGYGGYQDMQFGLWLTLSGKAWGVGTGITAGWALDIECSEHCKWTEEDRSAGFAKAMREINELMRKAKVTDVMKLVGKPVEAVFESMQLQSWRILEEVL